MNRSRPKRNRDRCRHCNVRLRGRRTDARRVGDDECERHPEPWCPMVHCWNLHNRRIIADDDPQSAGRLPRGQRIKPPSEYGSVLDAFRAEWRAWERQADTRREAKQPDAIRCGAKVARLRYAA